MSDMEGPNIIYVYINVCITRFQLYILISKHEPVMPHSNYIVSACVCMYLYVYIKQNTTYVYCTCSALHSCEFIDLYTSCIQLFVTQYTYSLCSSRFELLLHTLTHFDVLKSQQIWHSPVEIHPILFPFLGPLNLKNFICIMHFLL